MNSEKKIKKESLLDRIYAYHFENLKPSEKKSYVERYDEYWEKMIPVDFGHKTFKREISEDWLAMETIKHRINDVIEEIVKDLKNSLEFLILTKSNNTIHKLINKWEDRKYEF